MLQSFVKGLPTTRPKDTKEESITQFLRSFFLTGFDFREAMDVYADIRSWVGGRACKMPNKMLIPRMGTLPSG